MLRTGLAADGVCSVPPSSTGDGHVDLGSPGALGGPGPLNQRV